MNAVEFLSMNNPIRGYIQDIIEVRQLKQLSEFQGGDRVLEIGCGNGHGTRLIKKYFKPKKINAIDLDPRMIELAKKRNSDSTVTFEEADASKLKFPDHTFDAVFDFGIIHHIPNWKDCVQELHRVLKPEGKLILEDLSIESFETPFGRILRKILAHPYSAMYRQEEFLDYLKHINFHIEVTKSYYPLNLIKYFVVIARKF